MKRSSQLSLLSVMKRAMVCAGALFALLAFESAALAANTVDCYVDMENGNNGDVLTSTIMNATSHPSTFSWTPSGAAWVSTNHHHDLSGPVVVGGVTYTGTGGTRSWALNNNNQHVYIQSRWGSNQSRVTVAFYFTTAATSGYIDYDTVDITGAGGIFTVMQTLTTIAGGPYVRPHSKDSTGNSVAGPSIAITSGKTYWINMKYDSSVYTSSMAVFDPANDFAQVGSTSTCNSGADVKIGFQFGRISTDEHGNSSTDTSQCWFDNVLVDYTNATFPLIPFSGTDTTPPGAPPAVRDGTGTDIAYTTATTQLSANWDPAFDAQSGVSNYQYAIGTSAGGTQIVNWTTAGNVTTVTKTGLTLTNGQTYYFSVKGINGVGLTGNATNSDGQTVDSTAPSTPPTVRDGTGADISTTSSATQLSANWDASTDNESGISGYQYAIGTSAGGTQTVNWTSLGNVTTVTQMGLSLTNGQTYYIGVRAVNGAGLLSSITNSNGQTVQITDTTPPSAPANVRDGTGTDVATTSSVTQLSANWDASTDADTGISGYQYAIGTTVGGTQTVNWTSLGNVTTVTRTGMTLVVGQTYYFSVRAVNGAALTGSATNSNGQAVQPLVYFADNFESWAVHGGAWSSVNGENVNHTINTSTDHAAAGTKSLKITDTDSTGTTGASLTKNFSPVISGQIYVRFYLYLPGGYWSTNATCARRMVRMWCGSNRGQITVTGQMLTMEEVGGWTNVLWPNIWEDQWHCVEMYIGAPSSATPMQLWGDGVSYGTLTGAFSGSSTFDHIEFGDVALASGTTNDDGTFYMDEFILSNFYNGPVDTTPPSAPANVRDGTGADISTTSSTTQLSANWDVAVDNESQISGYQYAIGTTAGGTQTANWTSLGNVTTVTKTGLTLSVGQTYYFSVKAVNNAGLTGNATNSNGQTVVSGTDTTPPSAPPTVRDGTGTDISTTSSTTQVSANWDASTDNESGISGYQYAIGTSVGGTQTVNWTSLGNVTTVTKTGLTLSVGQTYYFSVKAVNGAGLTGSATNSNGQTVVSSSSVIYFQDNFESWTVHGGAWTSTNYESSTHTLNTSTDYAMAGAKSLKLTDTDTTAISYGAFLTKTFSPVISGDIYVRYFVFLPTGYLSANVGCGRRILRVWCGTNRGQMSIASGGYPSMDEVGGWSNATSSTALTENAWHCLEIHMATPSASTLMEFWVDGVKNAATLNGAFSGSTTYTYIEFGDVILNSSGTNGNGTFYLDELIVANYYIDPSPPSAPANVRDGTGTDISTTASTTQLSANWDAATDADSGISGYQYAIGTTAGGTQTINWTSLGNVTTVTQSGLTLIVGQTYYFSVRSVNGAGLNSAGTSSNGQTVVSSAVTYFSDNFENWTVHGGAWSSVNGESSNHTLNTSTDHAAAGSKCLKITDTDSTGTTGASLTKNFSPVISTDIYVRFYIFLPTGYGSANSTCARRILRVFTNTSNYTVITLTGDGLSLSEVGDWGGTGGPTLSENQWHCIELHVAPPSASTAIQYWVDGTSAGTCTGAFSGSSTFNYMQLGDVTLATGTTNDDGTLYWDEVIVSNAYNGPLP